MYREIYGSKQVEDLAVHDENLDDAIIDDNLVCAEASTIQQENALAKTTRLIDFAIARLSCVL